MFLVDWNEDDFGDLNFYDMYDILYPKVNGQYVPYVADDNLGVGAVYRIPKDEFESVIMKCNRGFYRRISENSQYTGTVENE